MLTKHTSVICSFKVGVGTDFTAIGCISHQPPPMQLHSPSCPLNSTFELLLKNCAFELLLRNAVQLFSFPTLEDHLLSALSTLVQIQCTVCAQLIMSKMPNIDINKVHFTSSPCNCTLAFRPLCSFAFFSSLENCSRLISHLATTSD